MHRRTFLKLGAVAGGAFFFGGGERLVSPSVVGAQSAVPTVDRLVMTSVVDNVYDVFARGGKIGDLTVQRHPLPPAGAPGPTLLSEHGLAYHLESFRGGERKEILLDFAQTGATLLSNYQAVKIDPSRADALILSHGHNDHYGALPDLAGMMSAWSERGITLYAGGSDTFCHRWIMGPDGQPRDWGQLHLPGLESRGIQAVLAEQPTVVAGHAVTSGHIPRLTDFETPLASFKLEAGAAGSGCDASLHFPSGTMQVETPAGDLVQDIFWGEHATAYHVQDRGLVVISSCGHAGIVNSIRQLQQVSGIEKVHAVVGGWHLAPSPPEVIASTVGALKDINPDYLIPMHCTGFPMISAMQREMPSKLILPSTGTRVVFGA
jgi:7,8-dihydropterin-6-yl-methyl-4-(beta-D-ribofuranosyl)aminobenzene 5'-phosphate synthase